MMMHRGMFAVVMLGLGCALHAIDRGCRRVCVVWVTWLGGDSGWFGRGCGCVFAAGGENGEGYGCQQQA